MSSKKSQEQSGDIADWVRTKLWDQVPIDIGVIDSSFKIIEANRSFTRTYGQWKGRFCYSVYKGKPEQCEDCPAVKTFVDGQIRVTEERGQVREGQQTYYLVHIVPVVRRDGEIPYVIEMSTDITQIKQLEQEKRVAERLAAVGQTVAGLAHGIKNVLMGLEGGMYMARTGIQRGNVERMLKGWKILEEDIARITSFTMEFLEFARGRTPARVRIVEPNVIATKVFKLFEDKARLAGIDLSVELDDSIEPAPMDAEDIHTCLTNLVSNALDACETSDELERHVKIRTTEQGNGFVFEVSDDGAGIDYEIKKKIFSNFFSTKASKKGTGLGLLTTRKIVQEHGGAVSFESTKGEGSVFRLEFSRSRLPRLESGVEQA